MFCIVLLKFVQSFKKAVTVDIILYCFIRCKIDTFYGEIVRQTCDIVEPDNVTFTLNDCFKPANAQNVKYCQFIIIILFFDSLKNNLVYNFLTMVYYKIK